MKTDVVYSSKSSEWATPQDFFDDLNEEFDFTLDPCATDENHKCEKYYTKTDDGLAKDWLGEVVFCNPPYGRDLPKWVRKCFFEAMYGGCKLAVMLIPARTDTQWFHDYIYGRAEIRFIRGRLRFGGSAMNAPFPSMLVIFRRAEI